jgi:hypothetical protein
LAIADLVENHNFTSIFDEQTSFCTKGCAAGFKIANFIRIFRDQSSFSAKELPFVTARWHCPYPPAFRREIKKRRGQEGKSKKGKRVKPGKRARGQRARGQEGKKAEEQEGKKSRCEDNKM